MNIGLSRKELEEYSILKAVRAFEKGQWKENSLEREVSQAIERSTGKRAIGFFLPSEVKERKLTTSSGGGGVVQRSNSFSELLRDNLVCRAAGATLAFVDGSGIFIPKQVGGTNAQWTSEVGEAQASTPAIEQVSLLPKDLSGFTEISRRLLLQSSFDIENFVISDLAKSLATAIDNAAIGGEGGELEPLGILNYDDIGEMFYGDSTPSWANIVEMETSVLNAIGFRPTDVFSYLTSPTMLGKMKCTPKSTGQDFIVGDGRLNGCNAFARSELENDEVLFGRFSDLFIFEYDATDIIVNPYILGLTGDVRISVRQTVAIVLLHAESFVVLRKEIVVP